MNYVKYALIAAMMAFAFPIFPVVAQTVAGALAATGSGASEWARAGGMLAVIVSGLSIASGRWMATIPMGLGAVTASQPNEVMGFLGF